MSEYFYRKSGRVIGPLSWQNIETLCQRGLIDHSTEIQKDGGRWKRAIDHDLLETYFKIDKSLDDMINAPRDTPPKREDKPFDFTKPREEQELVISRLYSEPTSSKPIPVKSEKSEEGSSFGSIAIISIIGIGAHACIFMNYESIESYVKGLARGNSQQTSKDVVERPITTPSVDSPNRSGARSTASDIAKPVMSKARTKAITARPMAIKPAANVLLDGEVNVIEATLGNVSLKHIADGKNAPVFPQPLIENDDGAPLSKARFLRIRFRVTNTNEFQPIEYQSWGGHGRAESATEVKLIDDRGNPLNMVKFGNDFVPSEAIASASIPPGESIDDVIVFQPPSRDVKSLTLFLPASHVGAQGVIKIEIPTIRRIAK